jgi:hypothetical protein
MGADGSVKEVRSIESVFARPQEVNWKAHSNVSDYMPLLKVVCYFDDFFSQEGLANRLKPGDGFQANPMHYTGTGSCPEVVFFVRSTLKGLSIYHSSVMAGV